MSKHLIATIDRIEEDKAVLIFDDGQNLPVSIGKLPSGIRQGDVIKLEISKDNNQSNKQENLAKDVLNEILNGD